MNPALAQALDLLSQVAIPIMSIVAGLLVARKNKWGQVIGLCSTPFWLFTSFYHSQWGVFVNSVIFTGIWIYGCYFWFTHDKPS